MESTGSYGGFENLSQRSRWGTELTPELRRPDQVLFEGSCRQFPTALGSPGS